MLNSRAASCLSRVSIDVSTMAAPGQLTELTEHLAPHSDELGRQAHGVVKQRHHRRMRVLVVLVFRHLRHERGEVVSEERMHEER